MSQSHSSVQVKSSFFIRHLEFENGKLVVSVGNSEADSQAIVFEYVRTVLIFKEGDFFRALEKYSHEKIIGGNERTVGVFRITKEPILGAVLDDNLIEENPNFFWVSTPDECLEVICFSEPRLI